MDKNLTHITVDSKQSLIDFNDILKNNIGKLKEKIKEYEEKIKEYEEKNKEYEEKNKEYEEKNKEYEDENKNLKLKLKKLEEDYLYINEEFGKLKNQSSDYLMKELEKNKQYRKELMKKHIEECKIKELKENGKLYENDLYNLKKTIYTFLIECKNDEYMKEIVKYYMQLIAMYESKKLEKYYKINEDNFNQDISFLKNETNSVQYSLEKIIYGFILECKNDIYKKEIVKYYIQLISSNFEECIIRKKDSIVKLFELCIEEKNMPMTSKIYLIEKYIELCNNNSDDEKIMNFIKKIITIYGSIYIYDRINTSKNIKDIIMKYINKIHNNDILSKRIEINKKNTEELLELYITNKFKIDYIEILIEKYIELYDDNKTIMNYIKKLMGYCHNNDNNDNCVKNIILKYINILHNRDKIN
jgi:hypothetical protein